jgi:hypothetical protein
LLTKPIGQGPQILPFPNTGASPQGRGGTSDYARFNPEYFRLAEKRILQLQAAGTQADSILFHPYALQRARRGKAESAARTLQ